MTVPFPSEVLHDVRRRRRRAADELAWLALQLARTGRDLAGPDPAHPVRWPARAAGAIGRLAGDLVEVDRGLVAAAALRRASGSATTAAEAQRVAARADALEERARGRWREALARCEAALDAAAPDRR